MHMKKDTRCCAYSKHWLWYYMAYNVIYRVRFPAVLFPKVACVCLWHIMCIVKYQNLIWFILYWLFIPTETPPESAPLVHIHIKWGWTPLVLLWDLRSANKVCMNLSLAYIVISNLLAYLLLSRSSSDEPSIIMVWMHKDAMEFNWMAWTFT